MKKEKLKFELNDYNRDINNDDLLEDLRNVSKKLNKDYPWCILSDDDFQVV